MDDVVRIELQGTTYNVSVVKDDDMSLQRLAGAAKLLVDASNMDERKAQIAEIAAIIYPKRTPSDPKNDELDKTIQTAIQSLTTTPATVEQIAAQLKTWITEEQRSGTTARGSSDLTEKLLPIVSAVLTSMPDFVGSRMNAQVAMAIGIILYGLTRKRGLNFHVERVVGGNK